MDDSAKPIDEIQQLTAQFVQGWARMLSFWDAGALQHGQRVAQVSLALAKRLGWRTSDLPALEAGALLHDIGKVCIPPAIFLSARPLTPEQWVTVKRHPVYGYEMIIPVQTMHLCANVVLCHHENWDGSGYPRGLSKGEISAGARIVAVAEVWDALTSHPEDRTEWPRARVMAYIRDHAGSKFDPAVVEQFLQLMKTA